MEQTCPSLKRSEFLTQELRALALGLGLVNAGPYMMIAFL
jgi:hypothetical protein